MSVSKSDSVRIAAPLFRALWAAASAAALVGCGGGGAEEPVDPATQEGPYLRDVAAGTSTLPRIDFPSTVSYVTAHDVQALLAADGRAVVRLQVAVTTRADGLVNHRELVYSRSTDGTWSAPETLDAPTAPETWHANDAGWVSTTVPAAPFDSIVRTDSDTRAMGTGIGQRLRSAPRHAVLPGQQRIGRLVDAQGNLYLIDRAQPTAPDTDWTVAQTRVSADGTVGLPQTVFKRNAVPHLTQNPTLTRAALFWDAPFIANQPIQWQVASLFIDTGTLFGSLPTGDPVHPNCAPPQDDMVTATPKWGTVMAYFHPDGNGGCERRVRVIDNRAPGVTAVSDRILDPEPQLATTSWWLSAGSEGQLLALWAKPTAETGRYELRTAVGQVPDQNAVDRTWTWSPTSTLEHPGTPMRLFGNVADFAVVTGSGGHVAVVYAGNLNNPQVDVWLRRYAPATGWEAPRKLFNGMPYAIKRTNVSVAPDGKVLVAYVDRNRCPLVGCVERLHPRVIVID